VDISELYLPQINVYPRGIDDYVLIHGTTPPGWNPQKPIQLWDDPTVSTAGVFTVTYNCAKLDIITGAPQVLPMPVSNAQASTPNIPPSAAALASLQPQPFRAGTTPVPIRALMANEKLIAGPARSIRVVVE
jgi:hypothetical protein